MTSLPPDVQKVYVVNAREWAVSTSSGDVGIVRRLLLDRGKLVAFRAVTAEPDASKRALVGYYATFEEAATASYNRWLREAPSAWTALSGNIAREPLPEPEQIRGVRPPRS